MIKLEIGVIRYANDAVPPIEGYRSIKFSTPEEARSAFQTSRMSSPVGRGISRRDPDSFIKGPPPNQVGVGTREGQRYQQENQDRTRAQGEELRNLLHYNVIATEILCAQTTNQGLHFPALQCSLPRPLPPMRIYGPSFLTLLVALCAQAQGPLPLDRIVIGGDNRMQFEVSSTTDHYYVLYFQPELDDPTGEFPVALKLGSAGTIVLSDQLGLTPGSGFYRVEEHLRSQAVDLDRDGINDVVELTDPTRGRLAPLNAAPPVSFTDGVCLIPDRQTFRDLSYQGDDVVIDFHLSGLEFVKFFILEAHTDNPTVYFMNTNTHRAHFLFGREVNLPGGPFGGANAMRGEIVYHPFLTAPNGKPGVYRFEFEPGDGYPFDRVQLAHELLAANMPFLENNLIFFPFGLAFPPYERDKDLFDASRIPIFLEDDLYGDISFLPLNIAQGFGLLRVLGPNEQPGTREIVIFESLPNELPRVGGVITTVPQTPLSHVNLRAIQDNIPNAYLRDALANQEVSSLIGKYVSFRVNADEFELREATLAEVEAHHVALRPADPQFPVRNLSVTSFQSLDTIGFSDSDAFGVKSANLATLRTLNLGSEVVPDGFALPFYFYDEYMKFNGFYDALSALLSDPDFESDLLKRDEMLKNFRKDLKAGVMPLWMVNELTALQFSFPFGTSIRCRSSTNNEDLPGFSGAGLYDSFTHHPDEHHLQKSIKQLYASLFNFRAFEERAFFRIDHFSTAMGVLLHPSFQNERANGVAVTDDPIYQTIGYYYLNTQVGENLVTNPEADSIPEEILLNITALTNTPYQLVRSSNQLAEDSLILTQAYQNQLEPILTTIHAHFRTLYEIPAQNQFAMEVEFKITAQGNLAIKQARPWLF